MEVRFARGSVVTLALITVVSSAACKSRNFNNEQASTKTTVVQRNDYRDTYVWINEVATGIVPGEDSYVCIYASRLNNVKLNLSFKSYKDTGLTDDQNAELLNKHKANMKPLHELRENARSVPYPPVSSKFLRDFLTSDAMSQQKLSKDHVFWGGGAFTAILTGAGGTAAALVNAGSTISFFPVLALNAVALAIQGELHRKRDQTSLTFSDLSKLMEKNREDQTKEYINQEYGSSGSETKPVANHEQGAVLTEDLSFPLTVILNRAVSLTETAMHVNYHKNPSISPYAWSLESIYGKDNVPSEENIGTQAQKIHTNSCAVSFDKVLKPEPKRPPAP